MGKLNLKILLCLALIAAQFQDGAQIVIKKQLVPALVESGKTESILLDCDYDLEGTPEKNLVVKWFLNENELVYQWIYNGEPPQSLDPVKKYIDLNYKASQDPAKMYRAMKLIKPEFDLTGEYTCTVFNFAGEATQKKEMIVYSTEDKFDLTYSKKTVNGTDGVEVTCVAEGLYPRPTLNVSFNGLDVEQNPEVTERIDKKYVIRTRVQITDKELSDPAEIICLLEIPDANYTISKEVVYYPGPPTTTTTATTTLQRKMDLQVLENSQPDTDNGGASAGRSISTELVMLLVSVTTGTILSVF